jgi:hypothetical protein
MMQGRIVAFHPKHRGNGRIACDGGPLLYMHRSACDFEPRVGDNVRFNVVTDSNGRLCAADVRLE